MKIYTIILYIKFAILASFCSNAQTITFTYDANGHCTSKQINGTQPIVSITGDTIACKGAIAKFTASGAGSYSWDIGGSGSTVSVIADTSKYYTLIGMNPSGCADTVKHYLSVVTVPVSSPIAGDTIATINSTDTFVAQYHLGSTYVWNVTGGQVTGGNGKDTIIVQWGNAKGKGIVELYETVNNNQCKGLSVFKNVDILGYPTSLSHVNSVGELNVYPNPAIRGVYVDFTVKEKSNVVLLVTSVDGKVVYKQQFKDIRSRKVFIEDRYFSVSGTYTITLSSSGDMLTEKVVYSKM